MSHIYSIFNILICIISTVNCARILGIFPTPSYSHQQPYQAVMKALASRGHTVTVLSPNPLKVPTTNYEDIDLSFSYEYWDSNTPGNDYYYTTMLDIDKWLTKISDGMCRIQLGSRQFQNFLTRKNNSYDLIIMELLNYQCFYGLLHYVGSPPIIGIGSTVPHYMHFSSVGNPSNPAYNPNPLSPYTNEMTLIQRIHNSIYYLYEYAIVRPKHLQRQERLMKQFFNETPYSVEEIDLNVSLVLVNSYWSCDYPIPRVPGIIEIGGIHVSNSSQMLPQDLKDFVDDAEDGFIYVSLGTNVRSDKMPEKQLMAILEVFSNIPYKVLWKWESDIMKNKPKNVKLKRWVLQQSILAHRNLKVFVTQGGIQSINEATYHGVPMLVIPVYGDQEHNAAKIASVGAGITIKFEDVNSENFNEALDNLLHNNTYMKHSKKFSSVCRDRPEHPLDRAIWWIEYVLRHNGSPHIRSSALKLSWYQIMLLDVAIVLIIFFLSSTLVVLYIINFLYKIFKFTWRKYFKIKIM